MNARFVTLVLLLFVWLEGDSVWAQYLPKLYQVFSPDKKLKMAIQRHNDGLLTYTFAANREILIKESPWVSNWNHRRRFLLPVGK